MTSMQERANWLEGTYEYLVTKGDVADVRGDVAEVWSEMRASIADLKSEIRANASDLKSDLQVHMQGLIRWVGMYVPVGLLGGLVLLGPIFWYL